MASEQQQSPVSTDIDFERDGKQISYLRVPHSRNTSAWGAVLIPITVIKNGDGPTVLLNGGTHGDEYEGPVCLMKLARGLEAEDVQGRVIIIPTLNLPAVQASQRLSPIDHKDMNRVFPGRSDGTISQIIAHYIYHNVLPLCDAVIDLHSGGHSLNLYPYISMHYLADEQQTAETLAALKAFQAPAALIMEEFSGEGLLDYAVEEMGKIFLCAELGGSGRLDVDALRVAETGTTNILKHFGILAGEVEIREQQGLPDTLMLEVPEPENYHRAPVDGIYESFYRLGEQVQAGDALGQMHHIQYPEREPDRIIAQRSGLLIGLRGPGQAEIGDCVAVVAEDLPSK